MLRSYFFNESINHVNGNTTAVSKVSYGEFRTLSSQSKGAIFITQRT